MTAPDLERLFAQYARSGEAAALAQVFDAAAPRLLLVACHLTRDRAAAEDLVQATFVAAIEDARRYDPTRPLLPWLCGILSRRARSAARQANRQLDAERLTPKAPLDPARTAEERDNAQRVHTAIEGLPPLYRHVLILHLVHELGAAQIAHSLGRSPETVRTQLRRGLQMLRGALPTGLALPALLLATEGRGLAAVRAAVVDQAATATTTAAASLGGLLLMKTTILATLAAAGLATVALSLNGWFAPTPPAAPHSPVDPDRLAPAGAVPTAATPAEPAPARLAVAPPTTEPPPAIVFVGRCVDATTSLPLADCTVTAHGRGSLPFQRVELARHTTAVDGGFTLRIAAVHGVELTLSATAADRVTTTAIWRDVAPGTIDVGDVPMPAGARCRGRIVDEHDAPLAGVELFTMVADPPFAGVNTRSQQLVAISAADGSFAFRDDPLLPPGSWPLTTTTELTIARPRHLVVAAHDRVLTPTVVVQRKPATARLTGIVHDPSGAPLAHVHVDLHPNTSGTQTAADGRFSLFRPDDVDDEVLLTLNGGEHFVTRRVGPVAWGRADLAFELQPAARPRLQVVDADSGAPIVKYGLATRWSDDVDGGTWGPNNYSGDHDDGIVEIGRVGAGGTLAVVILPEDPRLAVATLTTIEPQPHRTTRVPIAHRRAVRIRVCAADGEPAVGSDVEILHPAHPGTTTANTMVAALRNALNSLDARGWRMTYAIDRGTTDATGRVTLRAAPGQPLALRVSSTVHAPLVVDPFALPAAGDELRVEVATSGTLTGRCSPPPDLAQWARDPAVPIDIRRLGLVLRQPGEARPFLPAVGNSFPIAADGTFTIRGVPAGRYEVLLLWWRDATSAERRTVMVEPPLATVDVGDETLHLDLDITAHVPGRLLGRITDAGMPLTGAFVTLGKDNIGGHRTDADGRFVAGGLPAGAYRVFVIAPDPQGGDDLRFAGEAAATIEAGRATQFEFAVERIR